MIFCLIEVIYNIISMKICRDGSGCEMNKKLSALTGVAVLAFSMTACAPQQEKEVSAEKKNPLNTSLISKSWPTLGTKHPAK